MRQLEARREGPQQLGVREPVIPSVSFRKEDALSSLACKRLISQKGREDQKAHMKSNRLITFATITLLCFSHADLSYAQEKKEGKKGASEPATDHAKKAMELAQLGANDQAIEEFTKAIEAKPKEAVLYTNRGKLLRALNKFDEANADFTKAIELAPNQPAGYSERGATLTAQRQWETAMADLNKALELKPKDPLTLVRRGFIHYNYRNYDAALNDYNVALEQNPNDILGLNRRADVYVALNRLPEAKADLEAVLRIKPDDFTAADHMRFVMAKLAPPPAPVAAAPVAPTPPPPKKLLTRANVMIAIGALLVLGIVAVVIAKRAMTSRDSG
jgi:tetratricopeptide (TPR) repeat protein